MPGPLRLRDLAAYLCSLGFPEDPSLARSFLGTPIRHRGERVGGFFLADKQDCREFTREDEEVLALFASQAGAAIANARAYQDVERARSDVETLIDTAPVGVVVFDVRSGQVASVNAEARRIVDVLCLPDQSPEDLLKVLRVRRADGSELALDRLPLSEVLREATTVRVEEIVLEVPDGRRITTLINATPIRSEAGGIESMVVTMQDLTPLEEFEVLRAEFLGMVSHELKAPLSSIKGSAATVLGASSALRPAEALQFFRIIDEQADHMRELIADLLDAAHIEAGRLSVAPEPTRVASVGAGPDPVHERREHERRPDRSAAGPAAGARRPAAHRPGPGQPALERGPALAPVGAGPGGGGARGCACGGLGRRRGPRHPGRAPAAPVPQVRPRAPPGS